MTCGRFIDLTGKRIGVLLVVDRSSKNIHSGAYWNCICVKCGTTNVARSGWLSQITDGGCQKCHMNNLKKKTSERQLVDYTGLVSERLTVISNSPSKTRGGHARVFAACSCDGSVKEYTGTQIKAGLIRSCGCLVKENISIVGKMANTPQATAMANKSRARTRGIKDQYEAFLQQQENQNEHETYQFDGII